MNAAKMVLIDGFSTGRAAASLGCTQESIRTWVKKYRSRILPKPQMTVEEENRLAVFFLLENLDQLFIAYLNAFVFVADFVILAVRAAQIASAEKHSAAAFRAADARLFPEMQRSARKTKTLGTSAKAERIFSVYITFSRTIFTFHSFKF